MVEKNKKKKKELSGITKEPQREWLRCQLTEKEILDAAKKSSKALVKINNLETDLSAVKQKFKSDIEDQHKIMTENSQKVENGYEHRTVDCHWLKDWDKGTKKLVRLDTGEVINENVRIEPGERQTALEMIA